MFTRTVVANVTVFNESSRDALNERRIMGRERKKYGVSGFYAIIISLLLSSELKQQITSVF